jgi:hypothetical protein
VNPQESLKIPPRLNQSPCKKYFGAAIFRKALFKLNFLKKKKKKKTLHPTLAKIPQKTF